MIGSGFLPDTITYNPLIKYQRSVRSAERMFNEMRSRHLVPYACSYMAMMFVCGACRDARAAERWALEYLRSDSAWNESILLMLKRIMGTVQYERFYAQHEDLVLAARKRTLVTTPTRSLFKKRRSTPEASDPEQADWPVPKAKPTTTTATAAATTTTQQQQDEEDMRAEDESETNTSSSSSSSKRRTRRHHQHQQQQRSPNVV